jgi:hypothetical protein
MDKQKIGIKLGQLDSMISSLSNIVQKEMKIKLAYKLSKLMKTLASEHDFMISKRREIVGKYSEKDESGEIVQKDDKINILDIQSFNSEIEELHEIEFELEFEKIDIEDFGDLNISIQDLYNLDILLID